VDTFLLYLHRLRGCMCFAASADGLSEGRCTARHVFTCATLQFLALSDMVTDPIPDALSLAAHQSMHVCFSLDRLNLARSHPLFGRGVIASIFRNGNTRSLLQRCGDRAAQVFIFEVLVARSF
jgi:hypothetical protein